MRWNVLAVVAALGVGLGGGYLIGSRAHEAPATSPPRGQPPLVHEARALGEDPGGRPRADTAPPSPPSAPSAPTTGETGPAEPPSARAGAAPPGKDDCEALRTEVAHLRQVALAEHAMREDTEGRPIPFPADIDAKFRAPALMSGFTDAARAVGADAAEVEDIDCSELPCLLHGALPAGSGGADAARGKLEALMHTMEGAYAGAGKWLTSSTFEPGAGEPGEAYVRFTLSFYPQPEQGSPEQEALNKRMHFRRDQYDASAPGAPTPE